MVIITAECPLRKHYRSNNLTIVLMVTFTATEDTESPGCLILNNLGAVRCFSVVPKNLSYLFHIYFVFSSIY